MTWHANSAHVPPICSWRDMRTVRPKYAALIAAAKCFGEGACKHTPYMKHP